MSWIIGHWQELTEALLALLGFFSIVAKMTPTKMDNKVVNKALSFVHALGLTKK